MIYRVAKVKFNYKGQESWPDGSEYTGLYELGKKDTFGKYSQTDSSYYIGNINLLGEWKDNKINGFGVYCWADGRKFIGEWLNSKMNGWGVFYWADGRLYKGEYFKVDYLPAILALALEKQEKEFNKNINILEWEGEGVKEEDSVPDAENFYTWD